jgi:acetoin utilization deacetylase AcuC-like enzyme
MAKYALIRDGVLAAGVIAAPEMEEPDRCPRWSLELAHTRAYVDRVLGATLAPREVRRIGFPQVPELAERSLRTTQGTVEAARDALATGVGLNLAGGTHHATADVGEGFCVFNDVAVAVRTLQHEGRLQRVAVIDLDVHQGNGTAAIFAEDPDVYTFSMHGARNFPWRKVASTLDVPLDDDTDDATYLAALEEALDRVLDEARPDLVCYLAGADPFAGDRLGRLGLTLDGLRRRDARVFAATARRGLPLVMVLAGGYATDLSDIVRIHVQSVREFRRAYAA